jgi:hypothetical protein
VFSRKETPRHGDAAKFIRIMRDIRGFPENLYAACGAQRSSIRSNSYG